MNRVRIKVCGLTQTEDAKLASDLGADAVGMILYKNSPRQASLAQAAQIVQSIHPLCQSVAVVVNPSTDYVEQILEQTKVNMLQFHGDEPADFCAQFGVPYIKALRMADDLDLSAQMQQYASAAGLLLDTYVPGLVGGTGKTFNWSGVHGHQDPRFILAGGLNAGNVVSAVTQSGVAAVDISSGLESAPGIKDHSKVRAVFAALLDLEAV